jgi:polyhydroxybutyrate depolymerase
MKEQLQRRGAPTSVRTPPHYTSLMRTWLPIAAAVACTQPHLPESRQTNACEANAWPRQEIAIRVPVGRTTRNAIALIPAGPGPHDLVVSLHEFRSNPRTQLRYTGWPSALDELNAIVVAPDARYATWNAGTCCGRSVEKHIDDVAFLDALVDRVRAVTCTTDHVLATGIGAGGMMAQMWSCESDRPTAVVSVGGALQWHECRNKRPVPLLHIHGENDHFIPRDGSRRGLAAQEDIRYGVDHAVKQWRERNRAEAHASTQDGDLRCDSWSGQAPVTSCVVVGGADTWPGAADGLVTTQSPLADATRGGLRWAREAWTPSEATP